MSDSLRNAAAVAAAVTAVTAATTDTDTVTTTPSGTAAAAAAGSAIAIAIATAPAIGMCERLIYLQPALAAMAVDNKLLDYILLNETDWKILRQVHQLLKPFKNAQKLLEGDKYVTLSLLPIAIKSIRTALIKIVGAAWGGEA
jgi:hypothetical protein